MNSVQEKLIGAHIAGVLCTALQVLPWNNTRYESAQKSGKMADAVQSGFLSFLCIFHCVLTHAP